MGRKAGKRFGLTSPPILQRHAVANLPAVAMSYDTYLEPFGPARLLPVLTDMRAPSGDATIELRHWRAVTGTPQPGSERQSP